MNTLFDTDSPISSHRIDQDVFRGKLMQTHRGKPKQEEI